MNPESVYDGDYFLRGKETGKSLYENYRWLPELTIPMAQRIVKHCGIKAGHRVLDLGCARGYLVKALRHLGVDAHGIDISEWAIENADPETKPYLSLGIIAEVFQKEEFDWVIAKDVLEHIHFVDFAVKDMMCAASVGVFAVVPLSKYDKGRYVIEDYEKDVTHCQRWSLPTWASLFISPRWSVEVAYRVRGVKDNYSQYPMGNGFITARRLEE